jgi:hypothetical protein
MDRAEPDRAREDTRPYRIGLANDGAPATVRRGPVQRCQSWGIPVYLGSSRNQVGRARCYSDVNVHVNVNVHETGIMRAEGIAWQAWLQSL